VLGVTICVIDILIFITISGSGTGIFFRGDSLSRALSQGAVILIYFIYVNTDIDVSSFFVSGTIALSVPTIVILAHIQFAEFQLYYLGALHMAFQSAIACRVFTQIRIGVMTKFDGTETTRGLGSHVRTGSSR
jgi:hypothetical protein